MAVGEDATRVWVPRLADGSLNPRLAGSDLGDAFQVLTYQLLEGRYGDLRLLPTRGKDGGIDLMATASDGSRVAFECKHIGQNGHAAAQSRWREVARKLQRHLPARDESQYGPWWNAREPIRRYVLCLSSILENQQRRDDLRDAVQQFLRGLAIGQAHLAHLNDLEVEVLDWKDFEKLLQDRPYLLFRWFPRTRPTGLVPLDEPIEEGTFRSYLYGGKLPYYSRIEHLKHHPPPEETSVRGEQQLLDDVLTGPGVIITGKGGHGKTRLMLELGWLARTMDWTVFRVGRGLDDATLDRLAEQVTPDTIVLLLIDYIETQPGFTAAIQRLVDLNDTLLLRLRFIANCRESFYGSIAAAISHRHLTVTEARASQWYEGYRHATVRHILSSSGLDVSPRNLKTCQDVPVLAVFLAYLRATGRAAELEQLLEEADFGRWVLRRAELSFPGTSLEDVAFLVAMFPMSATSASALAGGSQLDLLHRLAVDGWIEQLPASEQHEEPSWVAVHDVLADQVVLSFLRTVDPFVAPVVRKLLVRAEEADSLRSAMLTLQRLVDRPELASVDWAGLFHDRIGSDPTGWRGVWDILIRTPLLQLKETVSLLVAFEELWQPILSEGAVQTSLGWLARRLVQDRTDKPPDTVIRWIQASYAARQNNYLLTSGLILAPEVLRQEALTWIHSFPLVFATHYTMTAWLNAGLPTSDISQSLGQWLGKFWATTHASFVFKAWLDAGGELDVVRLYLPAWLEQHGRGEVASFVYRGWLAAKGELDVVRPYLPAWLEQHGRSEDADFVYRAWLERRGDFDVVAEGALSWFSQNYTRPEATFLAKFIARNPEVPSETVRQVLAWCRAFPSNEDAFWRITQVGRRLLEEDLAEDVLETSSLLVTTALNVPDRLDLTTNGQITSLFSYLISANGLREGRRQKEVDDLLQRWLRFPKSFDISARTNPSAQRLAYFQRIVNMLTTQRLRPEHDAEALTRFLRWVDSWEPLNKSRCEPALQFLHRRFPEATPLWAIVRLPGSKPTADK